LRGVGDPWRPRHSFRNARCLGLARRERRAEGCAGRQQLAPSNARTRHAPAFSAWRTPARTTHLALTAVPAVITAETPISPAAAQRPLDRKEITAAPPISREPAQRQFNRKRSRVLSSAQGNNFAIAHRDAKDSNRRAQFVAAYAGEHKCPKGFWDWPC
jgi:hypothetical protein